MEPDEFEHIPWSNLVTEHRNQRVKVLYVVAAVVAAGLVGFVAIRWLSGPQHGPVNDEAVATTVAEVKDPPPADATALNTSPSPTVGTFTEADLMANDPQSHAALARMRAEWFVTDYFTVDGSPATATDLAKAFVVDAVVPTLPHESGEVTSASFVEWARAYRTETLASDRYLVDVAFRSIHRSADEAFRRGPVHAVEVTVVVGDGVAAIAELPIPVVPPQTGDLDGWWSGAPAAEDVGAAVLEYGLLFDSDPELVEATEGDGGWRGVVTIGDGSGIRWPVAVRSDRLIETP